MDETSTYWYLVQTRYPDPRSKFHLSNGIDANGVLRSVCASMPLTTAECRYESPTVPAVWMCRRCIAEAARRAA